MLSLSFLSSLLVLGDSQIVAFLGAMKTTPELTVHILHPIHKGILVLRKNPSLFIPNLHDDQAYICHNPNRPISTKNIQRLADLNNSCPGSVS